MLLRLSGQMRGGIVSGETITQLDCTLIAKQDQNEKSLEIALSRSLIMPLSILGIVAVEQ